MTQIKNSVLKMLCFVSIFSCSFRAFTTNDFIESRLLVGLAIISCLILIRVLSAASVASKQTGNKLKTIKHEDQQLSQSN